MATVYVRSTDGSDADDGSTWALADATLAASLTAAGAGGRSYASDNHAETQASAMTLASPGTTASPTEVICGDDAAEPPTAVTTTATVTTTGNSAITFTGSAYIFGITFRCASGGFGDINLLVSGANHKLVLVECELELANTNTLSDIFVGGATSTVNTHRIEWLNTDIRFGAAGQGIDVQGAELFWRGGTVLGTAPTTLFTPLSNGTVVPRIDCRGVDLSPLGSNTLINVSGASRLEVDFINCKLGASAVITTGAWASRTGYVRLVNCDSADTNYRYLLSTYHGDISHETTIVRTGGASDGTTPFSRKMVSTANTKFYSPLEGPWFEFWNETTGSSVTAAIEIVTDNVTLTDAEAWVEVEYMGTSGFPTGSFANDRAADILATPANQTTSSEAWTTTGLTTPVKQVLSKAVTPQEKGWIRARVCLAKASTTLYACPKILSTSAYQYMDDSGDIVNAPAAGAAGGIKIHPGMSGGLRG